MCLFVWFRIFSFLFIFLTAATGYDETEIKIGIVTSSPEDAQHLAAAAEAALKAVLGEDGTPASVLVAPVEPDEPLALPTQVCKQATEGVSAIVVAGDSREVTLAAEAAARAGIPLLLVTPSPERAQESEQDPDEPLSQAKPVLMGGLYWEALHMYPQPELIVQACGELCKEKGWREAVLLHDGALSSRLIADIEKANTETELLARRLPDPRDEDALRNLLLVLKKAKHTQFVVWCDAACCEWVLAEAQKIGLLAEKHSYILLALDFLTLDLEPYSHGGANITGLQLFNPIDETEMLESCREAYLNRLNAVSEDGADEATAENAENEANAIINAPPTALVLTYDAVKQAATALVEMNLISSPEASEDAESCPSDDAAENADTLLNVLRSEEWSGRAGARRAGSMYVVELNRGGTLEPVASWKPKQGLHWNRPPRFVPEPPPGTMENRTFIFLIQVSDPYVMRKSSPERLNGNDRYEGFCIELIDKLSQFLHFNYTLVEHWEGTYDDMLSILNKTHEADFAITDLTITEGRERVVDFTTPFMNLGISILYKQPTTPEPETFAFMLPFSRGVWICLGLAYVATSLLLYVVGRLCPEEWQNPYPCIEEPVALENQFTLANAFWFNLGAVLLQGSEIAPVAYGSRAVASAWWIFALVITSSYTANLATLLAKQANNEDFTNVKELAGNDMGITYGAKAGGATIKYFRDSTDDLYKKMYEKMQQWEQPADNPAGIVRVKESKFALFMESTSIEYNMERDCAIKQVGGLLDSKGYGIAMAKESPYRQAMNLALLNFQESGELRLMKHRWWKEKNGGGACNEAEEFSSEKLKMKSFIGLFYVLGVGCVLGIVVSFGDVALTTWRSPRDPSAPYFRRLGEELRFVFQFQRSVKPVQGPLIPPPPPETESIASEPLEEVNEEEREGEEEGETRLRSASFQSAGVRSRRRSSMHAASMRLARHARKRESNTSGRTTRHNDV